MIITSGDRQGSWHVGETMNIPEGRVISFQVDCDELDWLIDLFKKCIYEEDLPRVNYPASRLTPIY